MISHPIVLAVVVADFTAALLLMAASVGAIRLVLLWRPEAASRQQLALERRAEAISLRARVSVVLFVAATAVVVIAIASILPGVVPGAMCGTGVVEAMGSTGERALWLRALAIIALAMWHLIDRLNRSCPSAPLTTAAARALLLALPAICLAVVDTSRVLLTLDVQTSVDCCAVVYDAVRATRHSEGHLDGLLPWVWLMVAGAAVVVGIGTLAYRRRPSGRGTSTSIVVALAVTSILWVFVAHYALVRDLAAYHYGVLAHDCPWCLFAGRHLAVGYPLYGALVVVGLEGIAVALATIVADRRADVRSFASRRASKAALRVVIAVFCFLFLALLPAVLWRLRHGVWIAG